MTLFKNPSWRGLPVEKLAQASPEQVEAWRHDTIGCEAYNQLVEAELSNKMRACINLAAELWGLKSKAVRYLKRQPLPWRPSLDFQGSVLTRIEEYRKAQTAAEFVEKRAEENRKKTERAILWLQARGKALGQDFTLDHARYTANEIAYQQAVDAAASEGGLFEFLGDDGCKNCGGWDGSSHRCECGNRRVGWSRHDWFDFEKPEGGIYAEAH